MSWHAHYDDTVKYRCTIRGLMTKFPGFTYSGLNTIQFLGNTAVMSMDQYKGFMQDVLNLNDTYVERV